MLKTDYRRLKSERIPIQAHLMLTAAKIVQIQLPAEVSLPAKTVYVINGKDFLCSKCDLRR